MATLDHILKKENPFYFLSKYSQLGYKIFRPTNK